MSADSQSTSLEVARREASEALERPLPPMGDGEVAALWRTAKALADSGLFKDARQAGQAFAKVLAGRDLGLTPFEAMGSLHVVEGKIEASSDLHATRVRGRDGYDFRVAWLKVVSPAEGDGPPEVEAVWADEERLEDLRDTYGCAILFAVDGKTRGVSRFTLRDAQVARLVKDKSAWQSFPRNMLYARAMTNGVAWYVPEVMGGLRVYGTGELRGGESGEDLGAGAATSAPAMDTLPTAVEAVLARAREVGHSGLANRETAAHAVAGQSPEVVGQWVARATRELNRAAARARRGEAPEPEPPDAVVVPDAPGSGSGASNEGGESEPAQNEAVSGPEQGEGPTGTGEGTGAQETQPEPAERDESAEVVDAEPVHAPEHAAEHVAALEQRATDLAERLEAAKRTDPGSEEVRALNEELDAVETELDAATNPQQRTLGV